MVDHANRRTRRPYQGQVLSLLEQTGALGVKLNLSESPLEEDTERPELSKPSSEEPLYPLAAGYLGLLFRKRPPEVAPLSLPKVSSDHPRWEGHRPGS